MPVLVPALLLLLLVTLVHAYSMLSESRPSVSQVPQYLNVQSSAHQDQGQGQVCPERERERERESERERERES